MVIYRGENVWNITIQKAEVLPISNHESADRRSIFHAGIRDEVAVTVAKDTDVLLLLMYALGQMECFLPPRYMKIDDFQ